MSPQSPSSPRQIHVDPPAPRDHRSMSTSAASRSPVRALGGSQHRVSGSVAGSSYRDNVDVQRQMQQDIDSAMSMSRARSGSLVEPSPMLRGTLPRFSSSPIEETPFGMLSDAEERELERARHLDAIQSDDDDHGHYGRRGGEDGNHSDTASSSTYESRRRHSSDAGRRESTHERRQLSRAHPDSVGSAGQVQSVFNFAPMEQFAADEREHLEAEEADEERPGVQRRRSTSAVRRKSSPAEDGSGSSTRQGLPLGSNESVDPYDIDAGLQRPPSPYGGDSEPPFSLPKESELESDARQTNFHRRRARKLSKSNPVPRQAKLALFESFGVGNGGEEGLTGSALKAPRHGKQIPDPQPAFTEYTDAPPPGHERPYRFSFYSNALPVTIHARTLAELPAEGQTFEELFRGREEESSIPARAESESPSRKNTPNDPSLLSLGAPKNPPTVQSLALQNSLAKGVPPNMPGGSPPAPQAEDPEAYTWWLDVLSPTDEEMRMLSKVFGIHPLTTEDILLEETREKIELFRNYYLVCFRSFDQDPYSQTYLEPLNMYIIVFREGTLSFHFCATPHPQNVRRRIKHLKDYISVTSDWISYALIDDITDAFGPLIQSIEYEVDSIDELVLILKEAEQTDMLRRIGTCRKKVMGLLRLMGSKADVVKGLAKRCNENWLVAPKSDIGLYLSDIQDHLITMTSNLNHYEKILSRSHSNYLAQISIEMTDANNQINDVLSKLTALGTVLIPMNLITGLWGMNVNVPGQDVDSLHWFGGILGSLAAFAIIGAWATYRCFVQ